MSNSIPVLIMAVSAALLVSASYVRSSEKNYKHGSTLNAGYIQPIERVVPYEDIDYGFTLAVPEQWSPVITADVEDESSVLEPGYAVAFESPRSHKQDRFADYLMVEILPGAQSGAFASDGSQTEVVMVNERMAVTDVVKLDNFQIAGDNINLIVYQAEIVELGYTVGIFVIGEQSEAEVLEDAFKLALKTFQIPDDPFDLS